MTTKKRLLFLTPYFPPFENSAVIRVKNIAKYLSRLDWEITVVTIDPSIFARHGDASAAEEFLEKEGIKRICTGYSWRVLWAETVRPVYILRNRFLGGSIRKIASWMGVERGYGWIRHALKACGKLRPGDFDLILVTAPPHASFKAAHELSSRLKCPYVLDYRDLWTTNPHQAKIAREKTAQLLEKKLIGQAVAVTIVSKSCAGAVIEKFGFKEKIHVVSNGFDPEELSDVVAHDFNHFAVVYTGNFYRTKRTITPLLKTLKKVKEIDRSAASLIKFHYYGRHNEIVRKEANDLGIAESVIMHGQVPHKEALTAVKGASLVVVITSIYKNGDLSDRGVVTGKIFEALGLKRPILLMTPSGSDAGRILEQTGLGKRFSGDEIDAMADFILGLYHKKINIISKPENIEKHSWKHIAKCMDEILRAVLMIS